MAWDVRHVLGEFAAAAEVASGCRSGRGVVEAPNALETAIGERKPLAVPSVLIGFNEKSVIEHLTGCEGMIA